MLISSANAVVQLGKSITVIPFAHTQVVFGFPEYSSDNLLEQFETEEMVRWFKEMSWNHIPTKTVFFSSKSFAQLAMAGSKSKNDILLLVGSSLKSHELSFLLGFYRKIVWFPEDHLEVNRNLKRLSPRILIQTKKDVSKINRIRNWIFSFRPCCLIQEKN